MLVTQFKDIQREARQAPAPRVAGVLPADAYVVFVGRAGVKLSKSLAIRGISGLGFEKGFQAYQWLQNRSLNPEQPLPVAIFCDNELPDGAALIFRHETAKLSALSDIPFLILAENITADVRRQALMNGADDVYSPSANVDHVLMRIRFLEQIKPTQSKAQPIVQPGLPPMPVSKRAFDLVFALTLLVLLGPIFLLIVLLLRIERRGPVFYVSRRAGRGFQVFDFFKFRTMDADAEKRLPELMHLNTYQAPDSKPVFVKLNKDPRITPLGRFLRMTSLDELPQLFHVLAGDMSIVGNRPLPLYEAEKLTTDQWALRFMAPAGITGLWQVSRGSRALSEEARKRLDLQYAQHPCFLRDLWIIIRTVPALFRKEVF